MIAIRARAVEPGLGITPKTVAKPRKHTTVEDMKTGPSEPQATVPPEIEEALVVAFRCHTLPSDDCLSVLDPQLTRFSLHQCQSRHGGARLPDVEGGQPKRSRFGRYPIVSFRIDIAEVHAAEEIISVGIDRTGKFAATQFVDKACRLGIPSAFGRSRALPRPRHSHRQRHFACRAASEPRHHLLPADAL